MGDQGNCRKGNLAKYSTRVDEVGPDEDEDVAITTLSVPGTVPFPNRDAIVQLVFRCKANTGVAQDNADYIRGVLNRHLSPAELRRHFGDIYVAVVGQPACHKRWQGRLPADPDLPPDFSASLCIINSCAGGKCTPDEFPCPINDPASHHAYCLGSLDETCRAVSPVFGLLLRSCGLTLSTITMKRPFLASDDVHMSQVPSTQSSMILVFEPVLGEFESQERNHLSFLYRSVPLTQWRLTFLVQANLDPHTCFHAAIMRLPPLLVVNETRVSHLAPCLESISTRQSSVSPTGIRAFDGKTSSGHYLVATINWRLIRITVLLALLVPFPGV